MIRFASVLCVVLAACAPAPTSSNVVEHSGARNDAFRAAATHHDLPLDWLVAIGYQQGRFEAANAVDSMAADPEDPAETLADDVALDDTGDPATTDDGSAVGDHEMLDAFGVMYLSETQLAQAAQLTGAPVETLRADVAANIDAAAAILDDAWTRAGRTPDALRIVTARFLGFDGDAEAADLALADLDATLRDGFDMTTVDGEQLELLGTAPEPDVAEAVAPGKYPARQFIASPNFSSRQGLAIRYIVIHDIEGTQAGAIAVFKSRASEASAHYITRARDGHIVQMVVEANNAWHAGHGWFNRHSIGIEHEGFAHRKNGGGFYTDTQYRASARLSCAIAHRYGIPVDRKHIFGHMNVPSNLSSHTLCSDARGIAGACGGVSHHSDPGRFWNWTKYMTLVRGCVKAAG